MNENHDVSSLFSIHGKVALVTGGSRGIGLMIARGYVEAGATVYITSRTAEVCEAVAGELSAVGRCISLPSDLSTMAGVEHLVREISDREERLHILVNNAGAAWGEPIETFPEKGFDKITDLNLKSLFFLTRDLLPMLEKAATAEDPARVINIGSIDGLRVPIVPNFSYAAAKAAVHQLTRMLAVHLGGRNITVNAVAPGFFPSKMTRHLLENYRETFEKACPLGRIGEPADMAGIAVFLASRAASYINGAIIPVDGGHSLKTEA
ncbi:MAG: SDR family oxidoreductase [Acidobacteriota bacterium]|jgi:NAD(P)-dependent dehydrogenase (short-subunit alcohol dehydrogenase family)|nr:SDR family oxidoreductase [Acidobacteriota bacterium]